MVSLTIRNVDKSYGKVRAISNVTLSVNDGEFLVLVGPSGCGKSTLLRMIAGLEVMNAGSMHFGDKDVTNVDPKDRDVAMVFQNYALYPHMTVFENMSFSLQQRGTSASEIDRIVMETAKTLGIVELLQRKPGALSGGQRQRVAMGRAIVRNPAIYLMDEPLSNLDAKLRVKMRAELKLLRTRLGVTTVYVTHDQVEAMTMGDRVAVLAPIGEGVETNLQQVDSPQALYSAPCNLFVAGFIGSPAMNFFPVALAAKGRNIVLRIVGTDFTFTLTKANTPCLPALLRYVGKQVVVGVRPEFFSLAQSAKEEATLPVDVLVSELVGPDAYLHFDIPTPDVNVETAALLDDSRDLTKSSSRFTARVAAEALSSPTGKMFLTIDVTRLHYFDAETTLRIAV